MSNDRDNKREKPSAGGCQCQPTKHGDAQIASAIHDTPQAIAGQHFDEAVALIGDILQGVDPGSLHFADLPPQYSAAVVSMAGKIAGGMDPWLALEELSQSLNGDGADLLQAVEQEAQRRFATAGSRAPIIETDIPPLPA